MDGTANIKAVSSSSGHRATRFCGSADWSSCCARRSRTNRRRNARNSFRRRICRRDFCRLYHAQTPGDCRRIVLVVARRSLSRKSQKDRKQNSIDSKREPIRQQIWAQNAGWGRVRRSNRNALSTIRYATGPKQDVGTRHESLHEKTQWTAEPLWLTGSRIEAVEWYFDIMYRVLLVGKPNDADKIDAYIGSPRRNLARRNLM